MPSQRKLLPLTSLGVMFAGWLALIACNGITGANAIQITDDALEDEQDNSTVGQGGATTTSGAGGTMASNSSSAVASSSTGSGDSSSAASTGTGTGPDPCNWPSGPYGVGQGQTLPSNLSWQGYAPGATTPSTISIQEFFDCDGMKGIHAVLFDTSQYG